MTQNKNALPTAPQPAGTADRGLHRTGVVARMLRMPVATLRVWERRYGLSQPRLSPGGQRLYAADDVQRLALVKQLTDLGHAIGSLAPLDMAQLQRVAATHARALAVAQNSGPPDPAHVTPARAWRLAVVGAALGARLKRPALRDRIGRHVMLLGPFDDCAQAAAALGGSDLDALLIHAPQLHPGWLDSVDAAAPAFAAIPKAVLYGFAADPVCEALASAGTVLLREPQPDVVLAQWLHRMCLASTVPPSVSVSVSVSDKTAASGDAVRPRRWDEAALADFAARSSMVACECPRHMAELLMLLSHFETYSTECAHRNAADADLHTYLQEVAATSRARFEAALEHVALHEGLMLPASPRPVDAVVAPNPRPPMALNSAGPPRRP